MDVIHELKALISAQTRGLIAPTSISESSPLMEGGLGFDSVRIVELIFACENRFKIRLPESVLQIEGLTVAGLARQIESRLGEIK
ncbi:acyl carrier protein [Candidatus Sumerlaeota bacterium]|nr:acyl carrier protein [Candidatus Sumerlaeota bacterium]